MVRWGHGEVEGVTIMLGTNSRQHLARSVRLVIVGLALLVLPAVAAAQDPCEVSDVGGTVELPPVGCEYLSPDEAHEISAGLPIGTTIELAPIHKTFICSYGYGGFCTIALPPLVCEGVGGALGGHADCFDSDLELDISGTGGLAGFNRTLIVPLQVEVHTGPRNPGDPEQTFLTNMEFLEGEIFGDPDFCTFRFQGGSAFGLPSPGETTLTKLPNGNFNVDSFFDISYTIDFQGCPGSPLDGFGGRTQGTIRMQTGRPVVEPIPTLSTWGLMLFGGLLLAMLAVASFRRQRSEA